jgi:hypothetical protein
MPIPGEQLIFAYSDGTPVQLDLLIEKLRKDGKRVLADDEIGLVLYVGDLGIYQLKPTDGGEFLAQPVTQISRPRFHTRILRKQIGSTVLSVTEDAVFVVRDGQLLKKVRAEKLKPGMVLATGEKVYK